MSAVRFVAVPLTALALLALAAPGCSDDNGPDAFGSNLPGRDGGGSSGGDGSDTICLLNNCDLDRDCADCDGGATKCDQSAHRCVACGPTANGATCSSGQTCTKYGACVKNGVSCAEDANGVPTITCKNTADCGACGPKFRVCDTGSGKCVGCTSSNTTNCQSTDQCVTATGTCAPKCPAACNTDSDCGACGTADKPAHACNNHVCSTCSASKGCDGANAGDKCDLTHGTCVKQCGLGRPGVSNCSQDGNCAGCTGTTKCDLPVNSSGSPDGVCSAPATGCSDLGKSVVVLPEPFSEFTQACSKDADCANQQVGLDVGKILKDATGLSAINSANLNYSEHSCASIPLFNTGKSCGVCVPCKTDTDCADIDITSVAGQLFGPIGTVASSLLLDKAFGPNDHKINMFCQNVADGYGVCLPCPSILTRCAQTGDNVPATGKCSHDICKSNPDSSPLNKTGDGCTDNSACIAKVCDKDPYCCVKSWDAACVIDVDLYCSDKTCTPDSCAYRGAGWYCRNTPTEGGYQCAGDGSGSDQSTVIGYQCPAGRKCVSNDPPTDGNSANPKPTAQLCDTEGTDECPTGSMGKPKCVLAN